MSFRKNLNVGVNLENFKNMTIRKAYVLVVFNNTDPDNIGAVDLTQITLSEELTIGGQTLKSFSNGVPRALRYGIIHNNQQQVNQGVTTGGLWFGTAVGPFQNQIVIPLAENLILKENDLYTVQVQWNASFASSSTVIPTVYLIAEDGSDVQQPSQSLVMYQPVISTQQQQAFPCGTISDFLLLASSYEAPLLGGIGDNPWKNCSIDSTHYSDDISDDQLFMKRLQRYRNIEQKRNHVLNMMPDGCYLYNTKVELLLNLNLIGTDDTFVSYKMHHPNSTIFDRFVKRSDKTIVSKIETLAE